MALPFGSGMGTAGVNGQVHFWGCVLTENLAVLGRGEQRVVVRPPGTGVSLPVCVHKSVDLGWAVWNSRGAAACLY